MGRGLIIVFLAVSVAANVFFLGVHSGRYIHGALPKEPPQKHDMRHGGKSFDKSPLSIMRYAGDLPEEARDEFRAALRSSLPAARENFAKMREQRNELSALLAADDWDRDAVAAKMREIETERMAQRAALDAAFLDALETLTPDQRQQLLKAAEEDREKMRGRFHRRMDERGGPPMGDEPGHMPPPDGPPPSDIPPPGMDED